MSGVLGADGLKRIAGGPGDAKTLKDEISELRGLMGTLPEQAPENKTDFLVGCEGIKVELLEGSENPYKAMYVMATTCWGAPINKWERTEPKFRFMVVKAVLDGDALPLALEAPSFSFVVEGPSRSAFDQIARARLGVVFSAKGMRDNNWKDADIRVPTCIANNPVLLERFKKSALEAKDTYAFIVDSGKQSWQAARAILPMSVVYGWSMAINYNGLRSMCRKRMQFCEQEDTVATAWLLARAVTDKFPLLGGYLRPGCDFARRCTYHESYTLSEAFGALFKDCGRWPIPDQLDDKYAIFNESCSDIETMEKQLGVRLQRPEEFPATFHWDTISEVDRYYFNLK